MNANSQHPTQITTKDWLEYATKKLHNCGIASARLDAELILAQELYKDRTFLHAHSEYLVDPKILTIVNEKLGMRLKRMPIAYIHHSKEFYGRKFDVSPTTLIPRPESEEIIDSLKELSVNEQLNLNNDLLLIDVGTGCGVLGITAKLEFPAINVTLTDISEPALQIARKNAKKFDANVQIIQSDLLENCTNTPDVILANLPYVDPNWKRSNDTIYEPSLALFSDKDGQEIIEKLLIQASGKLRLNGFIIVEADPCQHKSLTEFANKLQLKITRQSGYVLTFQKIY